MTRPTDSAPAKRPYWLFITTDFCPQCGSTRTYRERRYTPRPERWEDRHEDNEVWDSCD